MDGILEIEHTDWTKFWLYLKFYLMAFLLILLGEKRFVIASKKRLDKAFEEMTLYDTYMLKNIELQQWLYENGAYDTGEDKSND